MAAPSHPTAAADRLAAASVQPPGAVAIARAVMALGHDAVILTDDINAEVLQASIDAVDSPLRPRLTCFPPAATRKPEAWRETFGHLLGGFAPPAHTQTHTHKCTHAQTRAHTARFRLSDCTGGPPRCQWRCG